MLDLKASALNHGTTFHQTERKVVPCSSSAQTLQFPTIYFKFKIKVHIVATRSVLFVFKWLLRLSALSPSHWPPCCSSAHHTCCLLWALTVVPLSTLASLTSFRSLLRFTSLRSTLNFSFKCCTPLPLTSCHPNPFYHYMFSLYFLHSTYCCLIYTWITHFIKVNDCCLSLSAKYKPQKNRYLC